MSTLFGDPRSMPGCFYKHKLNGGKSGAKFDLVSGGGELSIVQAFTVTQTDDYAPMKCLGDVAFINMFGRAAVAQVSVTLTLFIIDKSKYSGIFGKVGDGFKSKRISAGGRNESCALTIGSTPLVTCYPVSCSIRADSGQIGLGSADITGISLKYR